MQRTIGGVMGLFTRSKPKVAVPDRIESELLLGSGDGFYETGVRGEGPHRDHLSRVLARHRKSPGWDQGRVPVRAFLIPLGAEHYGNFAVEIDGVRVGFVEDSWVKLFGHIYTMSAGVVSRPVVFPVDAAICWKVSRGNPLSDVSVPLGVRLDLENERAVQEAWDDLD